MSINYDRRKNTTLLPFLLQVLVGDSVIHVLRISRSGPSKRGRFLAATGALLLEYYRRTGGLIIDPRAPDQQSTLFFVVILTKTIYRHRINIIIRGYSSRFFICSW